MSIEIARKHLTDRALADRIMEFDVSSATVELAAAAVGVEPARIAKTLSFKKGDGCILVVTAGDARIDNAKFRHTFGTKARMLSPEDALAMTGHAVGGVCPFGVPASAEVYTDISLQRFDTVYPAAGSSNSAVRLSCDELFAAADSKAWVDVCTLLSLERK
ncbi:MAG: YbaK/EbsC family protein [Christensenellaceae bacterium]|nr:YbaK/EbsC family protein [Christensenellaceae bacterium]